MGERFPADTQQRFHHHGRHHRLDAVEGGGHGGDIDVGHGQIAEQQHDEDGRDHEQRAGGDAADDPDCELQAEEVFITIGGGDFTGVYFPTGLAIADMINNRRHDYGMRATVEATMGSTFNVNAILAGHLDFGLAQSDIHYHAVTGLANWAKKGPQKELRAVFSLHNEPLTLVAAVDAGIEGIADLRGKRVSLGNPGFTQRRIVLDALASAGLDSESDIVPLTVFASEAPTQLQDNRIDAYFFTVGHPSETIRTALSTERKARIIPIFGPEIDKLVADNSYYIKSQIEMRQLYPDLEGQPDNVNTFGVVATLCTSSRIPVDASAPPASRVSKRT